MRNNDFTLFVGSLCYKEDRFDGERIKSSYLFDSISKYDNLKIINLSKNRFFETMKFLFNLIFNRKNIKKIVVSKDPRGATILHKIIKFLKFPQKKVVYFEIGPMLYDLIVEGKTKKDLFEKDYLIIVETNSMKKELNSLGFDNVDVFPNFKHIPDVPLITKKYPTKIIKLIYFSRIDSEKGIFDAIKAVIKINECTVKFTLDIYGLIPDKKTKEQLDILLQNIPYIKYIGKLDTDSKKSYQTLSEYDLHIFPTKYKEGFPGSLIDFFIAGVPTISSDFARYDDILTCETSFKFRRGDIDNLIERLNFVYNNQQLLPEMRKNNYMERYKFSETCFESFYKELLEKIEDEKC